MKRYLLNRDEFKIYFDLDGTMLTYTFSDDPKFHTVITLKDPSLYKDIRQELEEMYDSCNDENDGIGLVNDYLQTYDFEEKYCIGESYVYHDIRDRDEIDEYEQEAFDKVWLMRSHPCDDPHIEKGRINSIRRVLDTYDDIPENGYTDWECGYWNGILGALRWVLGEERDFLDT